MDSDEQGKRARQRGAELGRLAGKLVKNAGPRTKQFIDENRPKVDKAIQDARPRLEKAVKDYRPKVEQAGRDAAQYAHDHQDEIKGLAVRGAKMRMGPLGMAIDALGIANGPGQTQEQGVCPSCQAVTEANARFCTQCGAQLTVTPPSNG